MRKLCTLVSILSLFASPVVAQQGTPKDAPPQVVGAWTVSLETPHGTMKMALELRGDPKKLTGSLTTTQFGRLAVTGTYLDERLRFSATSENGELTFSGKLKDKDTLIGTLSGHAGDLPCTATRVKSAP